MIAFSLTGILTNSDFSGKTPTYGKVEVIVEGQKAPISLYLFFYYYFKDGKFESSFLTLDGAKIGFFIGSMSVSFYYSIISLQF